MTTKTTSESAPVASEGLPGGVRTAAECHAEFQSAVEAYEKARLEWLVEAANLRNADSELRALEADLELRKAAIAAEHQFQAKNAEGRARELLVALNDYEPWIKDNQMKQRLIDMRSAISSKMTVCRDTMSVQKRIMDFEIAYLSSLGGAL